MGYYNYDNYGNGRGGFLQMLPPATRHIIIINLLLFVATLINEDFMVRNFAMFYPTSPLFKPWPVSYTHLTLPTICSV